MSNIETFNNFDTYYESGKGVEGYIKNQVVSLTPPKGQFIS